MKRIIYWSFCVMATLSFVALISGSAIAKPRRGGGGGGGGGQSSGGGVYGGGPTSSPSSGGANSQAAQDLADLKAAETAVDETFETSNEWLAAQAAIKQAQSDYNDSSGPVLDSLKAQAPYQAAVDAQTKADANLKDQQTTGSPDQISDAAQADMQAKSAVKALESKAIATDPGTVAAKQRLTAAFAALAALREKEQDAIHSDPTWMAAKKRLDADRAR